MIICLMAAVLLASCSTAQRQPDKADKPTVEQADVTGLNGKDKPMLEDLRGLLLRE